MSLYSYKTGIWKGAKHTLLYVLPILLGLLVFLQAHCDFDAVYLLGSGLTLSWVLDFIINAIKYRLENPWEFKK